jgi:hypothetical protein
MGTYLAEAELVDPRLVHRPEAPPSTEYDGTAETEGSPVRGILIALWISAPFWALIAFTIYLLS